MVAQSNGGPCRGVPEFLDGLRALPHPPMLGLLTGNIRLGAEIKLRRYGLWDLFETGGFADDHEDRNHIAAAALERGRRVLGKNLRPEEIVVVGDTPFDIRCGKFIGAKVLAVATGGAKLDELKRHQPDWAVEDLTRVTAREVCCSRCSGASSSAELCAESNRHTRTASSEREFNGRGNGRRNNAAATAAARRSDAAAGVGGGENGKFLGQLL